MTHIGYLIFSFNLNDATIMPVLERNCCEKYYTDKAGILFVNVKDMSNDKPSYLDFNNEDYFWKPEIDYQINPERYRVGKGEQGVLICEPYKSEIGQHWRFRNEEIATTSSEIIFSLFLNYLKQDDFVGADMARKYLQMGFTRARRYFNYKGGKKYDAEKGYQQFERGTGDPEKAKAADIFYKKWKEAEANQKYAALKKSWKHKYG